MTLIEKSHKNEYYYISLAYESGLWVVSVYPVLKDNWIGYPIKQLKYCYDDKKQARATYRRYVKKYTD